MQYRKILIAIDDSPHAMNAARKGFELAEVLDAQIAIVSVIDVAKEVFSYDLGFLSRPSNKTHIEDANNCVDKVLEQYNGKHDVVRFTPEGFPKKEIIIISKEWGADLIVLGTHGHTGLSYVLLGSVAEYVVRHSAIPVLVVPLK